MNMPLKMALFPGETLGIVIDLLLLIQTFSSDYIQKMQYILILDLNFVNNNDMKYKNYHNALHGFKKYYTS